MTDNNLIIFVKNLIPGTVKTRLAEDIGMDLAMEVYKELVANTSDIPEISKKIIDEAFKKLDDHDVVIGPAEDGGYYLIGMKDDHKSLFENKEYGTNKVYKELVEAIKEAELSYTTVDTLNDLDTKADMKKAGIKIVIEDEDENEENLDY